MKRTRVAWAVASILLALTTITVVVAILVSATKSTEIREAQKTNTQTLDNTDRVLALLLDCTDPSGACYQRGQKSQADAIGAINNNAAASAAAAAICAREPGNTTYRALYACILAELEDNR